MRLTKKKIQEILIGILGESSLPLLEEIIGKSNVSEFDLAKKTKFDIKVVRKLLYILYNHNLVSFTRKKDKQKGWYIYYWTLNPDSIRFSYFKMRRDLLRKLQSRLEEEEKELFFISEDGTTRMNFDDATEYDFRCPDTGELLMQDDNSKLILQIKKRIKEVQEEVDQLLQLRRTRRVAVKAKKKEVKERKKVTRKKAAVKKKTVKKKVVKKPAKKAAKKPVTKAKKKKEKVAKKKETKKKVAKKRVVARKTAKGKAVKKKVAKKSVKKKASVKKTKKK